MGLTETELWGPEFDSLGGIGEFLLESVVIEGRRSLEIRIHVSPISEGMEKGEYIV